MPTAIRGLTMKHLTPASSPAAVAIMPPSAILSTKSFALYNSEFLRLFRHIAGINTAWSAIFLIVLVILLSGCSGLRIVDSQVNAFSQLHAAPAAGAAWAFERLPSQQNLESVAQIRRTTLEAAAMRQLASVGFAPAPAASGAAVQYTVQVSARTQRLAYGPFDHPEPGDFGHPFGGLAGRDYVVTGSGRVIYSPLWPRHNLPWYVREVALLIRDASSKAIVYETQAKHEGRWADDDAVLPAMLQAALQGFPKPPDGLRMVNIEIPR
jgi:Domain of unknown function (DUF4136)